MDGRPSTLVTHASASAKLWAEERMLDGIGGAPAPTEAPAPSAGAVARPATATLAVVLGLIHLGQVLLGGTGTLGLVRAGAQYPGALAEGAWSTLLTASLLHVSVLHVLMNAFFVWAVGGRLEASLGPARTLLVFFGGGMTGSLASGLLTRAVSAGASGGAWGLMVAELMLVAAPALRRGRPPPTTLDRALRLVVLNGVISLAPGVDGLAHLGGGLGGAAALVLTHAGSAFWPFVAGAAALAHASALIVTWTVGRPWTLDAGFDALVDRPVLDGLVVVRVPDGLTWSEEEGTLGRKHRDPVLLIPQIVPGDTEGWMAGLPEGTVWDEVACGPRCEARAGTFENGVRMVAWLQPYGDLALLGIVIVHPDAGEHAVGFADGLVGGLRWSSEGARRVVADATASARAGDAATAVAALDALLAELPDQPNALNELAWVLATGPEEVRDGPRALAVARRAVAARPDDGNVLDTLSAALELEGDLVGALEVQERAVRLRPDDEELAARLEHLRAVAPR